MDRKSIGEKIQDLAPIVFIISLIISSLSFVISMGYVSIMFGSVLEFYDIMSVSNTSNAMSVIIIFITNIVKSIVVYFCLKGFGHLLINFDKAISLMELGKENNLGETK